MGSRLRFGPGVDLAAPPDGGGPWHPAPRRPRARPDEVHVWRVALDVSSGRLRRIVHLLSSEERHRAERFHLERDRRRFVTRRALRRVILARYLGVAPEAIEFAQGASGKPELVSSSREPPLRFNATHSTGLALFAITRGREVGIDVEAVRPIPEAEGIARSLFLPAERIALAHERGGTLPVAFLAGWTRKEAVSKATGAGLAAVHEIEVTLAPGAPPRVLGIAGDSRAAAAWSLYALDPARGYVAAIAIEGERPRLCLWTLRTASYPGPSARRFASPQTT